MKARYTILLCIVLFLVSPAAGSVINVSISDDAYTDSLYPTTNYGGESIVWVGEVNGAAERQDGYMKAVMPSINGSAISSAHLWWIAGAKDSGADTIYVNRVTSSWDEGTITSNTAPTSTSENQASASVSAIGWVSYNITNFVQGWVNGTYANYGIKLNTTSSDWRMHGQSSEASLTYQRPYISIEYTYTTNGVTGIVYELNSSGAILPIANARVRLWNNTHSSDVITDAVGSYTFYDLANQTTYYLQATKTSEFKDGNSEIFTTVNNTWISKNLYLQRCVSGYDCFYNQNYIKFVVQNWFGTVKYPNVTVSVYKGTEAAASFTGTTGGDGAAGFLLVKDQPYRVTFINATQGISESFTLTPTKDDTYYIIVSSVVTPWQTNTSYTQVGTVNVDVTTSTINSTHSWINISYSDGLSQTTGLLFYLNQSNHTMPTAPQNIVSSFNAGATGNHTHNFTALSSGRSYLANVVATHTTFGTVYRSYGVNFPGMQSTAANFIPSFFKMLIAMGFMLFLGAVFGETRRAQGAGVVVVLGWIFLGFGWFDYFSSTASITAGLTVASLVVFMWNINERKNAEGVS